ncbi:MAG: bifunctional diaminohydroxyphosphoribosylaminopyrimidine deaminase/5-amino-6-(5-phosphoribosylamino)uracil reductase RibD [Deltaproteobacteria bacterium]|nr:bifunctional diaminohydroxyphosphoribosylaminopyrimidine deaminase/5-amino-6-(5-phosphoribosylamino)uracil reductase RibD [Deltaproteobacteria bacterium]
MKDVRVHERFMRMALGLAARGAGQSSPNPMVGAVLVRNGEVVSRGWHRAAGRDHAEVEALKAVGFRAPGCDLYVNLEPCCHQGRTPPCTGAVAHSGIRRVFVGMIDPNPKVSGKGIGQLRDQGIEVHTGLLETRARRLNAPFIKWVGTGRPLVTLKMASTLDGKTAQRDGSARWITSAQSRRQVHRMRSHCDCVMVGAGTARLDDPLLLPTLVRSGGVPVRAVVDETPSLAPDSQLVRTVADSPVLVFTTKSGDSSRIATLKEKGVEVVGLGGRDGLVPLSGVIDELGNRGIQSLLVEGGAELAAALIKEGLVDRFLLFMAPRLLGDPSARPLCDDMGIRTLDHALQFTVIHTRRLGPDIMVEMEPGSR